jgi:hypothetical protein
VTRSLRSPGLLDVQHAWHASLYSIYDLRVQCTQCCCDFLRAQSCAVVLCLLHLCWLLLCSNYTYARSRTGSLLLRFPSRLPGGGPSSGGGASCYCVLDCILQEPQQDKQQQAAMDADMAPAGDSTPAAPPSSQQQQPSSSCTFFIQDVLAWRGYSLVDCGAEFRLFWLTSKLQEEEAASSSSSSWTLDGGDPGPGHPHRCTPSWQVPVYVEARVRDAASVQLYAW